MRGEYRFSKTQAGTTRFARVEVELEPGSGPLQITFDPLVGVVPQPLIAVTTAGAMLATQSISHAHPELPRIERIRVLSLQWSASDPFADAVRCAAAIAVWRAMLPDEPVPEPSFDGRWQVKFE